MTAASAVLALLLLAANTPWQDFSDWFSRQGIPGAPEQALKSWGAKLKADGLSEADIQSRIDAVRAYATTHEREGLTLHFNRIYTWADAPFTREPSAFLRRIAATRKPGKALDIAMGQGRNSIWLASQGWAVSGYDISDEALRQAASGAKAAGVQLDTKLASHDEYELGTSRWDLIVMSYAFTNLHDKAYMKQVYDSLRPGGMLLVEGFSGGKQDPGNGVLREFLQYRVLVFEDLQDTADWGKMKAPLLRMAVEKPSAQ